MFGLQLLFEQEDSDHPDLGLKPQYLFVSLAVPTTVMYHPYPLLFY
jgi:hypothetical protein